MGVCPIFKRKAAKKEIALCESLIKEDPKEIARNYYIIGLFQDYTQLL
jgi:hypothetical protein